MTDPNANAMVAALQRGGVGLMPTDTVYGLVCHPDHATGKPRIFELKQRPTALNLQVLLPEGLPPAAIGAVVIPAAEALLRRRELAAGITFILALDPAAKPGWLADREEVGVRVPGDPRAQAVLAQTGPLFATSANAHGKPPGATVAAILADLAGAPDAIWDAGRLGGTASTVVNFNTSPPTVLRWGMICDLTEFGLGHG